MAFVVEDGTGKEDANAYSDVAFADSHFTDKGLTAKWGSDEAAKKAAIIRATEYMDLRWGSSLGGNIESKSPRQALQIPRENLYDSHGFIVEGVPTNWKKACCEYALISLTSDLMPNPVNATNTGQSVTSSKTKIGPLEFEYAFSKSQGDALVKSYPIPDLMVQDYLTAGSVSNNRVTR